jgi:hypothetical protein
LSLGVAETISNGRQATVTVGGAMQVFTLQAKTGALNVVATATDQESGVQTVDVWMTKTTRNCDSSGKCSNQGPGLAGTPRFESTGPVAKPGANVAATSILADTLDLTSEIAPGAPAAGSSRIVTLEFWATAKNHLGAMSQTAHATANWSE